jgi:sulfur relay (sulfurtransferase) DsrF/TusC family protein
MVDNTAPTISITAPAAGAKVKGTVTVTAGASDNVGVSKVGFYVDGSLKSTDTSSPYSYSWNTTSLANGSHSIYAKAYDAAGNVKQSSIISVTVDNTAPTVSITAPAANAKVKGTVTVTASASDNVGVSKVEFYVDGVLKRTDTSSPYSYGWRTTSLANGSHIIYAKAYDAAGNVTQSATVSVTVSN